MQQELVYRMAFAQLRGVTPALADEMISRIGSEQQFFEMSRRQLGAVMGHDNRLFVDDYRAALLSDAKAEAEFVDRNHIRALYYTDPDYPVRLRQIVDAPLLIYTLGHADLDRGHFISIVGTRHATPYGIDFVNRLVADLSSRLEEPLTVVSGLAFGIDAAAHSASLKNKVPTVGVLAHGLNTIYPAQHRSMAAEIIRSGGALVTEYPSSARIHKGNFLARNRIVAALADCVIVAESAERGGALVTARLASGYSRDVFALPGRTSDPYSAGCNRLIAADSAALITDASDLISRMMWNEKPQQPAQPALFRELTPAEQSVIDVLTELGEASLNRLATASGVSIGLLMSMLVDMEFRGLILSFPGGKYRLA